ncbi:AbfB domain-containing protein [Actinomadura craniellae]|nr:AbfB domain-containing protein [Actinomadura craniellae]
MVAWRLSVESANPRERFIRHRNFEARLDNISGHQAEKDGTFAVVPGLANGNLFSFQSFNVDNHYLRHHNFRMKLGRHVPGDRVFEEDATFYLSPSLAFVDGLLMYTFSFRSFNNPDRYVRHRNFEIWLDRFEDSPQFRSDAAFILRRALFTAI